jgi:ribonuclease J
MAAKTKPLYFLPLGGSGEIGMNMNLFGYGDKWMMVDCGMGFAGDNLPGVDLILPDPKFIAEQKDRLLGLVLTHAHEDHIGAVPYLWAQLQCPIFATPFTAGMVRAKLSEAGLLDDVPLYEIGLNGNIELGPFDIKYVTLAHSIAEPNALLIKTPAGTIFHTGDWKIDADPIVGEPADIAELTAIGDDGVLAMVCDSTNVFNIGTSGSERDVHGPLSAIVAQQKGRVAVTGFASNIARIHTIASVAAENGRKVCLVGRSMRRNTSIAQSSGYLTDLAPFISEDESATLPRNKVLYLCTGSQGEQRGAMQRIASGEHRHIKLDGRDLVIFSSKAIPGNEVSLASLYNKFASNEVETITEKDSPVHVSGHPGRPDLVEMYGWIRPQISVPVHGERRHLLEHQTLAHDIQVPFCSPGQNGTMIELTPKGPRFVKEVDFGRLAVDGRNVTPTRSTAVKERQKVSTEGHLVITVLLDDGAEPIQPPAISTLGIPKAEAVQDKVLDTVESVLYRMSRKQRFQQDKMAEAIRIAARRACEGVSGKRPVTDVQIMRLPRG